MAEKLTREQLKGLTAEEKIEYQRKQNAARVAAYRAANKEKAAEYNRTYKKEYVNRPENRDKYKELNKKYVDKYKKQQREVLKALTIMSANRNVEKLTKNEEERKKTIEEGKAIMQRIDKRRDQKK
jgi:DNA-binding transcriptional regulator YbjK